ncbi:MAG: hypothetical protein WA160_02720 [Pseudobdellovibrio sp.]
MKKLLAVFIFATALNVNAQSTGRSEAKPETVGREQPIGFSGFAEVSSGYTANVDEIPVEGAPNAVKLLGSYYLDNKRGVFDAGIGALTQTFIDKGAKEDSKSTSMVELAARYQFENRWQLGAVYNQFFDVGTNYYSNQGDALFGGLQVAKEFTVATNTHMRVGLRAMRDINTDKQDVDIAMLDLAIGWNPTF